MIFVGANNIGQAITFLALAAVVVLAIAYWVVRRGRKRGSTTIALDTVLTLSAWITGVGLLLAIVRFGAALVEDSVLLTTSQVHLDTPEKFLDPHAALAGSGGVRLDAIYSDATRVSLSNVALGARAMLATGQFLTALAIIAPFALVAVICFETIRGRTFGRTVIRSLWTTAGVILVAGVAGSALAPFGEYLALKDIDPAYAPQSIQTGVSLIAIGGALLCAAFAAVFQHGARLQRDTEGLV